MYTCMNKSKLESVKMKRIWRFSLLLALFVILITGICVSAQAYTKGWAQGKIKAVCEEHKIDVNKYWCKDPDNPKAKAHDASNKVGKLHTYKNIGQCHGFARFIAETAFRTTAHKEWKTVEEITRNGLHVGDLIRTNSKNHTALIYDIDSKGNLIVIECWGGEDKKGKPYNNIIYYKKTWFAGTSSNVEKLLNSKGYGKLAFVWHYTSNTSDPIWGGPEFVKAPTVYSVKFSKTAATQGQEVTITVRTSLNAAKLTMYDENGNKAKTWKKGYTDCDKVRTWKLTFKFSKAGNRTLGFTATNIFDKESDALIARITVTEPPTLNSVDFYKKKVTQKQKVMILAETSTNTVQLAMYDENGKKAKIWNTGYVDTDGVRIWMVYYAFKDAGKRTLTFRAIDANEAETKGRTAKITITKAPKLNSVAFSKSKAKVKEKVTITAKTSTNATGINVYLADGTKVLTWTKDYKDKGDVRTWKVTYAFPLAGTWKLTFKAVDANGAETDGKTVSIKIVK